MGICGYLQKRCQGGDEACAGKPIRIVQISLFHRIAGNDVENRPGFFVFVSLQTIWEVIY